MKFNQGIQEHEEGKFNSGLAIIYRLNNIHNGLHNATLTRDYESWYGYLMCFYKEICRMFAKGTKDHKEKEKQMLKLWEQVRDNYFEIKKLIKNKQPIPDEKFNVFHEWEIELVKLEQEFSLGMPTKAGSMHALGQ